MKVRPPLSTFHSIRGYSCLTFIPASATRLRYRAQHLVPELAEWSYVVCDGELLHGSGTPATVSQLYSYMMLYCYT